MASKVALLIGVTGHRDAVVTSGSLEHNNELIISALMDALQYWRKMVGEETPIWLLTGMAVGPDLLAIEAIELLMKSEPDWHSANADVIPVLPMPRDDYIKDFDGADNKSKVCFEYYLNKYEHNIIDIVPPMSPDDLAFARQDSDYGELRNQLYLNQGAFLSRYSNVLFAVWDGKDNDSVGGTADVVKMKCGIPHPHVQAVHPSLRAISRFDGQNGGFVQHIRVQRNQDKGGEDISTTLKAIDAGLFSELSSLYVCHQCAESPSSVFTDSLHKEMSTLVDQLKSFNSRTTVGSQSGQRGISQGLGKASGIFYQADSTALAIQKRYRRQLFVFMGLAMFAFTLYEMVPNLLNSVVGLGTMSALLLTVAAAFFTIKWSGGARLKWQYQLSRMVAESLRLRCFLNLAGVPPSNQPMMPRRYRPLFPIVTQALLLGELVLWQKKPVLNIEDAKKYWIDDQIAYLDKKLEMKSESGARGLKWLHAHPKKAFQTFTNASLRLLILAFIMGVGMLVIQGVLFWVSQDVVSSKMTDHCEVINNISTFAILHWWCEGHDFVMFATQLTVMCGGVIALWIELSNYRASTAGFEGMRFLYKKAQELLNEPLSEEDLRSLLNELAREAMQEHVEWNLSEEDSDLAKR